MKITRHGWIAAAATLAYVAFCVVASARKALWFDELFTLYVAELPDSGTMFTALRGGMDNHPPISYLLSHYSMALVGHTALGLRLPSIVAVWIGLVALYRLVAARTTPEAGACAVLVVASSAVFPYAVEARAYSLVFAGACLTLLAWQRCLAEVRARWAPVLLFLSLTVTMHTHLYAILFLVPLGLAELVRAVDRRRLDVPVALALVGGLLNVAPLYWFAKQANAGFALHFWAKPGGIGSIVRAYEELFAGLWLPMGAVLVLLVCWRALAGRGAPPATATPAAAGVTRWELAALVGLLAVPAVMWVLAKLVTQVFYFRYALITVIGAAALFGAAMASTADRAIMRVAVVVLALLVPVAWLKQRDGERGITAQGKRDIAYAQKLAESKGEVVVFDNPLDFLPAYHYAPANVRSRLYTLIDPDWELATCEHDSFSRAYQGLERYRDVHAVDLRTFLAGHRRFVLVSAPTFITFTLQWLVKEPGAKVELMGMEGGRSAYQVTLPEG